jgi:hypothetical protein
MRSDKERYPISLGSGFREAIQHPLKLVHVLTADSQDGPVNSAALLPLPESGEPRVVVVSLTEEEATLLFNTVSNSIHQGQAPARWFTTNTHLL